MLVTFWDRTRDLSPINHVHFQFRIVVFYLQDWEKSKMFREGTERKFCRDNYLSSITFEMIYAVRAQLLGQLRASGFVSSKGINDVKELNSNSGNWALVKGILVATLYPNICGVDKEKNSLFNGYVQ